MGCSKCDTDGDVKRITVPGLTGTYCAACFQREARRRGLTAGEAAAIYVYAEA